MALLIPQPPTSNLQPPTSNLQPPTIPTMNQTTRRPEPRITRVFGLHLVHVPVGAFCGNLIRPAVVLQQTHDHEVGPYAQWTLTIRTAAGETVVYWNGGLSFWWNSAHLARRFGQFVDTDFGGYWRWRGHVDL